MDQETGWYNFGARYLDPKTGIWLSTDPALGEYIPRAPLTKEDKEANGKLPGNGGIYNPINFALYHFAGNNPIRYVDPDGKFSDQSNYNGSDNAHADSQYGHDEVTAMVNRANTIIANNTTTNPTNYGSPGGEGTIVDVNSKTMDCTAFVSAVTQTPYKGTSEIATSGIPGFHSVNASEYKKGDVYWVRYTTKEGEIGHAQFNLGDGKYADSVDATNRKGPGETTKSTHDYITEKGYTIVSEGYYRRNEDN